MQHTQLTLFAVLGAALLGPHAANAQAAKPAAHALTKEQKIANAVLAAPKSITARATFMDWDNTILKAGTNGWTCLPDMPESLGDDPMCLDAAWLNWAAAWKSKTAPTYTSIGIGYMLHGSGGAESNTDPYATAPTPTNEWITDNIPHIMMLVPDPRLLESMPTDPHNGGPWVMWKGTPYVHVMIPTPRGAATSKSR
jgi:hypothetical protein